MIIIQQIERVAQNKVKVKITNNDFVKQYVVVGESKNDIKSLSYSDELSRLLGENLRSAQGFQDFHAVIWQFLDGDKIKLPHTLPSFTADS